jgi:hypothetical protein
MFGFLQKEKKDTIVAIFDISSGGVGGAIVNMDPLPIILSSARVAINSEKINGFDDLARATEKALGAVAYHVHQDNVAIPEKIICTLASPWYVSETRIIQMDRAESFTFTKKLADELLNKELSALARNDFEIIENRVMQVLIDGKSYEYPIGLVGKSIEMNMVTALSPQIFLDTIREKLSHTYPHISLHLLYPRIWRRPRHTYIPIHIYYLILLEKLQICLLSRTVCSRCPFHFRVVKIPYCVLSLEILLVNVEMFRRFWRCIQPTHLKQNKEKISHTHLLLLKSCGPNHFYKYSNRYQKVLLSRTLFS